MTDKQSNPSHFTPLLSTYCFSLHLLGRREQALHAMLGQRTVKEESSEQDMDMESQCDTTSASGEFIYLA